MNTKEIAERYIAGPLPSYSDEKELSHAYLDLKKEHEGHEQLKKFYQVDSFYDLIEAQDGHIGKLQAKLKPQEGMVLVPEEPTEEMLKAGTHGLLVADHIAHIIYNAMIAKAKEKP